MTYLEACEKDLGIKELHERYLALMKEAGEFAGRAFAIYFERYLCPALSESEAGDHE